ncbi:hypothetical protein LINPERPRIM_LOCUS41013 [Linum perenne]
MRQRSSSLHWSPQYQPFLEGCRLLGAVRYLVIHRVRSWSRHCLRGGGRRRTPSTWSLARPLSL